MYTVSKGPSKIVAKTRRGISQNFERLDNFRDSKRNEEDIEITSPKPVFHAVNGKKSHSFRTKQEVISPHHEELIKFVHESWMSVCKETESTESNSTGSSSVVYFEAEPNPKLKDFKPFDLESWWGKRLFNTITKSIP